MTAEAVATTTRGPRSESHRFSRVLVANRGEIARRIIRSLHALEIEAVAVFSDLEEQALHVLEADFAVNIGPAPVAESYLNVERLVETALQQGAQAIHPGYGLLSESAEFAEACEATGLTFIGPTAAVIRTMGSKVAARQAMSAAGIPIVPGTVRPADSVETAIAAAGEIGYPVAVKASAGGGGRGIRVAKSPAELPAAFESAANEGLRYFNSAEVYVEKYFEDPRHIEVQILGDRHGNVVHLGERDCSIQRRHQKLIEETPAPTLSEHLRAEITKVAVAAARSVGYNSAGTIEGLVAGDEFYFLEMNTRLQVEHTVTEMVSGIDLVAEQVRIAEGNELGYDQMSVHSTGHAIECRINAEDASRGFVPRPGEISTYVEPQGEGIRVDSGVTVGDVITPYYDPMFAKLVAWGKDRHEATERMQDALASFEITGIPTLIPFHAALIQTDQWKRGETCRDLLENPKWLRELA